MANPGTTKWFATRAEQKVARVYSAVHSRSSGASVVSKGDSKQRLGTRVALQDQLIESKHRGTFAKPAKSASVTLKILEKLADEAWMESREPVLHLSIYNPDSSLADSDGEINIICRTMSDDIRREAMLKSITYD